jgi:hypothetical protein
MTSTMMVEDTIEREVLPPSLPVRQKTREVCYDSDDDDDDDIQFLRRQLPSLPVRQKTREIHTGY